MLGYKQQQSERTPIIVITVSGDSADDSHVDFANNNDEQ